MRMLLAAKMPERKLMSHKSLFLRLAWQGIAFGLSKNDSNLLTRPDLPCVTIGLKGTTPNLTSSKPSQLRQVMSQLRSQQWSCGPPPKKQQSTEVLATPPRERNSSDNHTCLVVNRISMAKLGCTTYEQGHA